MEPPRKWWATKDLNLGPLPCEGSALTTELVARAIPFLAEALGIINRWRPSSNEHRSAESVGRIAKRGRARDSRQRRRHRTRHRGAARAWPLAHRRRSRRWQNHARASLGSILPLYVPAHSVHFR